MDCRSVDFCADCLLVDKSDESHFAEWLNRWLGSGLGALKFLLLTSVVIGAIEFVDGDNKLISATKKKNPCYIIRWRRLREFFSLLQRI